MSAISAATPEQLTKVRAKKQAARLYLAVISPPVIFSAQINGTPASLDNVVSVAFDNVTAGAYTDLFADQRVLVGSQPGLRDIGEVRLRGATATVLTIGEESEVRLADGQYLSALRDVGLWAKPLTVLNDGTAFMDGNIAYSDQNASQTPLPVLGVPCIKEITGASVTTAWTAAGSWVPDSTIASVAWSCVGGTVSAPTSTATNISFSAPGQYLVKCVTTAATGKTAVGYRWVHVYAKRAYYGTGVATVTRARSANVATLTTATHGLTNGAVISIRGLSDTRYNREGVTVTVINSTTLTYPCPGSDETTQSETGGTVHARVYAAAPPTRLNSFNGSVDYRRGGVEFSARLYSGALTTEIHERDLVLVFAEDYYAGVLASVGQIADRENLVCAGWITAENLEGDQMGGLVEFSAAGPQAWLGAETAYPFGIESAASTPAAWTEMQNLTIDKAVAHLATWRSTLSVVCDVYPGADTRESPACLAQTGSLWAQLTEITARQILAQPCSDQFGRVFVEVDTQFLPAAERAGVPIIMTLEESDLTDSVNLERVLVTPTSRVELSGVAFTGDSATSPTYFSLAPGHVFKRFGTPDPVNQLLLSSQAQANQLAGLILGQRNNEYPSIGLSLSENNRLFSVCPRQMVTLNLPADLTPRGIAFTGHALPREVSWSYQSGSLLTSLQLEAETFEDLSTNGDIPVTTETSPGVFEVTTWTLPALPEFPPTRPPKTAKNPIYVPLPRPFVSPGIFAVYVPNYGLYFTKNLTDAAPTWTLTTPLTTWAQADINSIVHFSLNRYGRAFLANTKELWACLPGAAGRTVLGSQAFFELTYPGADYSISGIGAMWETDDRAAVYVGGRFIAGDNNSRGSAQYLQSSSTALTRTKMTYENDQVSAPPDGRPGHLTFADNHWFASYALPNPLNTSRLRRLDAGLTTWEYLSASFGNPTVVGAHHAHATAADVIYTGGSRLNNLGESVTALGVTWDVYIQSVACDPTGQYVMALIGSYQGGFTLMKSYNWGVTWVTVAAFPHTISGGTCRIVNFGDLNKWVVVSNISGTVQLRIYATADFGATWVSKLGDLTTLVPATAILGEAHYA